MKKIFTVFVLFSLIGLSGVFAQINLQNGLIAYYPFNGNANDESGNSNNGTLQGQTTFENGVVGTCAKFRGNQLGDYISIPPVNLSLTQFSISAWVNVTNIDSGLYMEEEDILSFDDVNSPNHFALSVRRNGSVSQTDSLGFHFWIPGLLYFNTNLKFFPNSWLHVVGTYDGIKARIYVNGILESESVSIINASINTTADMWINSHYYWGANTQGRMGGNIDEVRLYDRALNQSEISALNNEPLSNCLVADYPFNGNANDASGNGNNGTVSGATLTTDRFGNPNSAYYFDGVNDNKIIIPNSSSLNISSNEISISMWIKWQNNEADYTYRGLSKGGVEVGSGYELLVRGVSYFGGDSGIFEFNIAPNANYYVQNANSYKTQWVHLLSVFNNGIGKIYVNGILSSIDTSSITSILPNTDDLYLGIRNPNNNYAGQLDGCLDDIHIYNCALDSADIDSLYNIGGWGDCLVADYPFDGNANDVSGNGNNATVNGATLTTDRFGNTNSAYSFDGVNDLITSPLLGGFTDEITLSAWYKSDGTQNNSSGIVCSRSGFSQLNGLNVDNTYISFHLVNIGAGLVYNTPLDNQWHFITGTYKNGVTKLFYDNQLVASNNAVVNFTVDQPFEIGHDNFSGEIRYFYGSIEDVRIYRCALDSADIDSLYNACNILVSQAATPTGTTQLCINPSNTTYTTTGATNATAYIWEILPSNAGTITGTGTTATVNWNNTFTGTATIHVKGINGACEGVYSNTISITVNALPTVTLGSLSSVCVNAASFTLTGGSPSGGTYSGTGVSGTSFNPATAGVGTHTITYTYTNFGCANSASNTITVNAVPTIVISGLNSSYCLNAATVTLSATPAGGSFSGQGVNGSIFNPANAGVGNHTITYTVTQGGCTNSASQNVTVNTLPVVSFTGLIPSYSSNDGPSTLTGIPAGGVFSGDGISGNIFYPVNAGLGSHNIVYVYTDGNGCMNATCQTTDLITKVGDYKNSDNTINIFPNPNNGTFQITFAVSTSQNIKVEIFNNIGQIVYTDKKNNYYGQFNETIDLRAFSSGVYLIGTKIGEKTFSNKVTIED